MPAPRGETQKSFGLIIDGLLSVKNSLATSHCQILPLKWVTSSVTCLCSRLRSWPLPMLPSLTPAVGRAPVGGAPGRLDALPLHLVARGDHGELVAGDLRVGGVVELEGRHR